MRPAARGPLAVSWFGAIFSLLTLGVALPSAARAGCTGHFVTWRSQPVGAPADLAFLDIGGTVPTPDDAPPERPTPCSGALCSGNPATPLSATPTVPPPGLGQWALTVTPVSLSGPESVACAPEDADLRPAIGLCSVFHPPRPLAPSFIA